MSIFFELGAKVAGLLKILFSNHIWSERFAITLGFVCLVLLIDFIRRGFKMSWTRRMVESAGANVVFWVGNVLFAPMVYLGATFVKAGYDLMGLPHVDEAFWNGVPAWVLIPFAILCYDFANYWNHRAMHHRWLWPIHAIHHSDPDMNPLTTYRVHFLEPLVMASSYIVLLSWLGFPTDVMGLGAVVVVLHNMYVHTNIDWDHGPFKYIIASPRMHQWHHADLPAAYGKNLANVFPFFDVLFGTYYVPGPCKEPFGAQGVPQNDVVKLVLFPFAEWARIAKKRLGVTKQSGSMEKEAAVQDIKWEEKLGFVEPETESGTSQPQAKTAFREKNTPAHSAEV